MPAPIWEFEQMCLKLSLKRCQWSGRADVDRQIVPSTSRSNTERSIADGTKSCKRHVLNPLTCRCICINHFHTRYLFLVKSVCPPHLFTINFVLQHASLASGQHLFYLPPFKSTTIWHTWDAALSETDHLCLITVRQPEHGPVFCCCQHVCLLCCNCTQLASSIPDCALSG